MTAQAEELLGVQVTGADGKIIGTIEQVFGDQAEGVLAWARVRSGRTSRFVPLGSSQLTHEGLSIPFDAQQIMSGPKLEIADEMSAAQAEELGQYYALTTPAREQQRGGAEEAEQRGRAEEAEQRGRAEEGQQRGGAEEGQQRGRAGGDWLVRREERLQVRKETVESGHVKLHRYVDDDTAEETVTLIHEEYDVERVPLAEDERVDGDLGEDEQEITLHEERVIVNKQAVPVERMRLVSKPVEENQTVQDGIRRERIEVEPEEQLASSGRSRSKSRS